MDALLLVVEVEDLLLVVGFIVLPVLVAEVLVLVPQDPLDFLMVLSLVALLSPVPVLVGVDVECRLVLPLRGSAS